MKRCFTLERRARTPALHPHFPTTNFSIENPQNLPFPQRFAVYDVRCCAGLRIHRQLDNSHVRTATSHSIDRDTSNGQIVSTAPRFLV